MTASALTCLNDYHFDPDTDSDPDPDPDPENQMRLPWECRMIQLT